MRILFVAMADSVHVARWLSALEATGWDLHLWSSLPDGRTHPDLRHVTVHHDFYNPLASAATHSTCRIKGVPVPWWHLRDLAQSLSSRLRPESRARRLAALIRKLRPDVIHAMEFQSGAYTVRQAMRFCDSFPPWIATNWGSDISLFGRLPSHRDRVADVLAHCDFYSCECNRDVTLAHAMGLSGNVLPVFPNSGGFDLEPLAGLRNDTPPSRRNTVLVKGYQNWAGRALNAIQALRRCSDLLHGHRVRIYSACDAVAIAAELFELETGVPTQVIRRKLPHADMLALHAEARVSIGLSIGDGISTSFLEAMAAGAFPVQSDTSCASEWARHETSCLLVPPEDIDAITTALRRALSDDTLVDTASLINWETVKQRLDRRMICGQILQFYQTVHQGKRA